MGQSNGGAILQRTLKERKPSQSQPLHKSAVTRVHKDCTLSRKFEQMKTDSENFLKLLINTFYREVMIPLKWYRIPIYGMEMGDCEQQKDWKSLLEKFLSQKGFS